MKILKTKKQFKNSSEVRKFFTEEKKENGVIPYKGGYAIVKDKRVDRIFVGKDALKNAKKFK